MHPVGYTSPERLEFNMDPKKDVFWRQNEAARQRWSAQEPEEPAKVHNPLRPSALAGRRKKSPPHVLTERQRDTSNLPPGGSASAPMSTSSGSSPEAKPEDEDKLPTPTSAEVEYSMMVAGGNELLEIFQKFNEGKNETLHNLQQLLNQEKAKNQRWMESSFQPLGPSKVLAQRREQRRTGLASAAPPPAVHQMVEEEEEGVYSGNTSSSSFGLGISGIPGQTSGGTSPEARSPPAFRNVMAGTMSPIFSASIDGEEDTRAMKDRPITGSTRITTPSEFRSDNAPAKKSRPLISPASETGSRKKRSRIFSAPPSDRVLRLQVKLRLLPGIILLKQAQDLQKEHPTPPQGSTGQRSRTTERSVVDMDLINSALPHVQSALSLARSYNNKPLMGLCSFYNGACHAAKSSIDGKDHKAQPHFVEAETLAKGIFPEGEWAGKWAQQCKALSAKGLSPIHESQHTDESKKRSTAESGSSVSLTAKERPWSSGSWVGSLWDIVLGQKPTNGDERPVMPLKELVERAQWVVDESKKPTRPDSGGNLAVEPRTRPGMGNRIPTFSTVETEKSVPYNVLGGHVSIDALGSPESADRGTLGKLKVANASSSSSGGVAVDSTDGTGFPEQEQEQAQAHSPSPKSHGHAKKKSVAFTALDSTLKQLTEAVSGSGSRENSPQASPTSIISDSASEIARKTTRRLSSAFAVVTGRDGRPDLVDYAEQGQSPFRSTFADIKEEEGVRRRKKSAEEMV